ncbi:lipopolysaccharide biosynthesis protein [Rhizobium sp. Root274]|uniref:glycosyltransferase n=1 Tax=unclassified Rhizobium TaxID=2613769 RepID=UPI0007140232|nr:MULTISPECIES: glycosyltransferase [unclassified Rhizobium]KQW28935.1 lipopolysaccharide biosynthesis protein [Rhizobium sp. Root1240]KRD29131.1 lipopolysaccharide biosynthesis protein [Rhizobium sp. Root274]
MKVFHYHFGKDGGAERFFVHLVNALAKRGVEQTAVIRPDRLWRKDIEQVCGIIESNFRNMSPDRLLLPIRVRMMAEREKPDGLMSWATRASRLMPAYKGCVRLSRLGDFPTNLSYFKNTDILVCNTPAIGEHVRKLGWTRGVEVISNFTDTEIVTPIERARTGTPEGVPVVMSMGRFVRRKGFHTLIEAVSRLSPDVHLWLAGDGEEADSLRGLAADLGMTGRVRFLGWQKDTRPYVAASDVFVMPSSHEPLGNVILEAWAQRKPVVSSRSEGPSWFMRDGENGLFAEIGNADSFAGAIRRVIEEPALAESIANGGTATLMGQFSEAAVADAYIGLFERQVIARS